MTVLANNGSIITIDNVASDRAGIVGSETSYTVTIDSADIGTTVNEEYSFATPTGTKTINSYYSPVENANPTTAQTTIRFDAGAISTDETNVTLAIETKDAAAAIASEEASTFNISNNGSIIGSISLTLSEGASIDSEKYVTVTTYIGTGYSSEEGAIKVIYAGENGGQPVDVSYNSTTGMVTFKTNHFSDFFIANAKPVKVTKNNGDVVFFATLPEAVTASEGGETICLLSDLNGAGIFLARGNKTL